MAAPGEMTINELAQLSVEEQIDALAHIWDQLAQANAVVPLRENEKALLDQCLAAEQHQSGESWESVRSSLEELDRNLCGAAPEPELH